MGAVGEMVGANVGADVGALEGTSTNGACTTAAGIAVTKLELTALNVVGLAKRVSRSAGDTVGE